MRGYRTSLKVVSCTETGPRMSLTRWYSRRTQRDNNGNVQASFPPYAADNSHHTHTAEEIVKSRANGQHAPDSNDTTHTPENLAHRPEPLGATVPGMGTPMTAQSQPQINGQMMNGQQPLPQQSPHPSPYATSPLPPLSSQQPVQLKSDIVYSYYPFLNISNLHNVLPQDVNYLELQGCFRVPTKAILDEFVQQYFLHVHPFLPLFHEGDFWDIYCQQASGSTAGQRLSLLVFQALIFASCNVCVFSSQCRLTALT